MTKHVALNYGEYTIPEGCVIKRSGNSLTIRESKARKVPVTEFRCKDCKFFGTGPSTRSYWYKTTVCLAKQKTVFKDTPIYYATKPYGKLCDKFEQK